MLLRWPYLVGFVVLCAGCSSPQPSASASGSVSPTSGASASATARETAAGSAATSAPAADPPGGLKLDPTWLTDEPKLAEVLAIAKPICVLEEKLLHDLEPDKGYSKSYSANAPTRDAEALQRDLESAANRLSLPLVDEQIRAVKLIGIEATGSSAFVMGTSVVVSVKGKQTLREEAIALARLRSLASVELLEALGTARIRELGIQRNAAGGSTGAWVVDAPPNAAKVVETWAKKTGLGKVDGGWLRTVDEKDPSKPAFVVDVTAEKVSVMEIRGAQIGGPACAAPAPKPEPAGSTRKPEADADLMQEMMGE